MAELRFPFRHPDDELATDLGDVIRQAAADGQLTDTEASIAREIRTRLVLDGARTSEDAVERLEGLGAAGQRQWLDDARQAVGLLSATDLEQRREDARFESAWQRLQPPPPPQWSPLQGCPAKGCNARPTTPSGAWQEVECEQWWCPAHRAGHEADMEPHEPAYVGISLTGKPIPSPREAARIAAWHEEHQAEEEREREAREDHDRREAEALDQGRRALRPRGLRQLSPASGCTRDTSRCHERHDLGPLLARGSPLRCRVDSCPWTTC